MKDIGLYKPPTMINAPVNALCTQNAFGCTTPKPCWKITPVYFAIYPAIKTQSKKNICNRVSFVLMPIEGWVRCTIKTPNIFATNHLFPETLDQYFINSLCAPSTFSTTSSVLASILCICSLQSVSLGQAPTWILNEPLLRHHCCQLSEDAP